MSSIRSSILPPTFEEETLLWTQGHLRVAGVDEAGRGALAGPVVAAAVIVPPHAPLRDVWAEVRDSKLLRPVQRATLEPRIQDAALAWGVGIVPAAVIDQIGIAAATRQAMLRALTVLSVPPDFLLIDWVKLPQSRLPQRCVAKADQKMASVAAASVLAKVTRDRLLSALGEQYPAYGFSAHKGYGSRQHLAALKLHGPCPEHRHSFAPVARPAMLWEGDEAAR